MNDNFPAKTLTAVIAFSIAMAFLEAAVVVYLRELYYPEGFCFPHRIISDQYKSGNRSECVGFFSMGNIFDRSVIGCDCLYSCNEKM